MNKANFVIAGLLLTFIFPMRPALSDDEPDVYELMRARIESARIRKFPPQIEITDEQLKAADPNRILEVLAPYEKDNDSSVRHMTHRFIVRIANLHSDNTKVRQKITMRLVKAEFDGNDRGVYKLMNLTSGDFNDLSINLIRQALVKPKSGKIGGDPSVWLCGIANIQEEIPRLKELLIDEESYTKAPNNMVPWYYTTGWAARLARARLGIKEDITKCIELAESVEDPDERVLRILPDIGYIRQPESIEYLKKYFLSDISLPPTNPGMEGESYSKYLMPILDDNLSNFPIKKSGSHKLGRIYSKEEIELCRKWMSEQKEWKIIR